MKSTLQKLALAVTFLLVSVPSALGQNYPMPWKEGGTPTVCPNDTSICPGNNTSGQPNVGLKTYPFSAPLLAHTGRFLDSSFTTNFQHLGIRTLRARRVRIARTQRGSAPPRAYIQLGSAIAAYSLDRFFSTALPGGMVSVKSVVNGVSRGDYAPEKVVKFDGLVDPEATGHTRLFGDVCVAGEWCVQYADGQDRLFDFDFDDRGYLYMATGTWGWGIVRDGGETGAQRFAFVGQVFENSASIIDPRMITVVKTGGKYYAVVSDDTGLEGRVVFDVTTPTAPAANGAKKLGSQYAFISWAKDDARERIALVVGGYKSRKIEIYNYSTLVSGGSPIQTIDGGDKDFRDVTVDEDGNFWTSEVTPTLGANQLVKLERNSTGYTKRSFDVFGGPFTSDDSPPESFNTIEYGDKYLTVVGRSAGFQQDVRLFKIEGGEPAPVNLNSYFRNYYWSAPATYAEPPGSDSSFGAYPIKWNNKTYLIQSTNGLGDVYELQAGDSISVSQKSGTYGTSNPYAKSTESGPFYGDILAFTAVSSNPTFAYNLTWNFGNPETTDDDAVPGRTGADIEHQYTGLGTSTKIAAAKNVKATATSNADMNDSVSVTLKVPTARIGIKGTSIVHTTDSGSLDLVGGDELTDASDGIVEGHYAAWTIDSTTSKKKPNETVAAGAVGPHTMTLAATYGKYDAAFATTGAPYVDSVSSVSYVVRPFVASFGTHAKSGSTVTFKGSARKTAQPSLMTATTWTVQWSLKGPTGTDLVTPTSAVVAVGTVPDFPVTVSIPNKSKLKLRISVLTSEVAAEAASYNAHEVEEELLIPDPKITKSGCANVGEPCSFTVSSVSGASMSGWTLSWSLKKDNTQVATGTGTTFAPVATEPGSYTASVTATTAIFTGTDDEGPFTMAGAICGPLPDQSLISIYASCKNNCDTNKDITLRAEVWGYQFQGCEEYQWTFGDGTSLNTTSRSTTHKWSTKGTKRVTLKIKKGTAISSSVSEDIVIGETIQPPVCTAPTGIGVTYSGNKGCGPGTNCKTGESVTFYATRGGFGLQTCDGVQWDFGDGGSSTSVNGSHTYQSAGSYTVSAVVSNTAGTSSPATIEVNVVQDNNCPAPPPASKLYIQYTGAGSGCSSSNPAKLCQPNETITFKPRGFPTDSFASCDQFEWKFGDNTSSSQKEPQHNYAGTVASYRVSMRVYNVTNSTGTTVELDVPFQNQPVKEPPQLSASGFAANGTKGNAVTFTVTSNIDATGWEWNFGDGQKDTTKGTFIGKSNTTTHVYDVAGTYSVSVKARNADDSGSNPPFTTVARNIVIDDVPEYKFLLPAVAHSAGNGGSVWRTDVQIYSQDPTVSPSTPIAFTATFRGTNFPMALSTSTQIYPDFMALLRPGQSDQGAVVITMKTRYRPQIWSRTYNQTDAGTFGQFIPAIPLDEAGGGSAFGTGHYYIAGLRGDTVSPNRSYRTNLGLVNPNAQSITAIVRVYDDSGIAFGTAISRPLAPFQLDQFGVPGPTDRPFSVEIEVPEGAWVIAYASVIDGGSGDPVYIQATRESELASSDYRDSVLPGVGHTGDWRSDVTIFNPNSRTVTVDLAYHDENGAKLGDAKNLPISAGSFLQYSDLLKEGVLGNVANGLGMLRVTVPATVSAEHFPLTFARTYNDNGSGKTYGQGIGGFAANRANVKPGVRSLIPAVRSDDKYYTNVGMTNVSPNPITVTIKVLDPVTGAEIRSDPHSLGVNESKVAPNYNLEGRASASLRVEVSGGNAWVFASIIDKGTKDPEYVPATPLQ